MFYTGVGSRRVPPDMWVVLSDYAEFLARAGYTLRSGAADGSDEAFETGADRARGAKEIYLAWRGFNGSKSHLHYLTIEAMELAAQVHPKWNNLSPAAQRLQGRNMYQVLGYELVLPSEFLLCWTPDGIERDVERTKHSGGTATAIALADRNGVPVFNLARAGSMTRFNNYLRARGLTNMPHCELDL